MFKASSVCDIIEFAQTVEYKMTPKLANFLFATGLFEVTFDTNVMSLLKRANMGTYTFFCVCTGAADNGDFMREFTAGVYDHILYGKDTEDADSVGGYSQREINLIMDQINAL